jgi:hypothetical protein
MITTRDNLQVGTLTIASGIFTGSGASTYTLPSVSDTLAGTNATQSMYNKTIFSSSLQNVTNFTGSFYTSSLIIPKITGSTFAAGTTTVAPIVLTSGTNLTTATAGSFEYDGVVSYFTPQSTQRGILPAPQIIVPSSSITLSNINTAQPIFGATIGTASLSSGTTYMFYGFYSLTNGGTTHTTALSFTGTATLTNILYSAEIVSAVQGTISTSVSNVVINTASSTVINATSTASGSQIWVQGVARINAGGTFIPTLTFSSAPGGTNQTNINSYFYIYPVGNGSVQSVGAWT